MGPGKAAKQAAEERAEEIAAAKAVIESRLRLNRAGIPRGRRNFQRHSTTLQSRQTPTKRA